MQAIWDFFVHRWPDLVLAVALAALFAIITELMRIGSRSRQQLRHIKNKLAEHSVARLSRRIVDLEKLRNEWKTHLSSDRALYVNVLYRISSTLYLMCSGVLTLSLALLVKLRAPKELPSDWAVSVMVVVAIINFLLAIIQAFVGFRATLSHETRERIERVIAQLDKEINDLRAKTDLQK